MPRIPSLSPATEKPVPPYYVHTTDGSFVDNHGRTLLLRGVNLSGSSKTPLGQPSQFRDEMWDSGESGEDSFIGRPLNLEDGSADVHLARLRGWGFNMLRFPVTWEALEHEGPGIYDYEFMDYVVRVLRKCKEYGFRVFIDPHQDVWSRFSGGSGAPYWTLVACGINPHNFTATQAAILHSEYPNAQNPDPQHLPAMLWSTNYGRLASQSLFTLFFAGKDYAPKCIIDGQNIQDYLQSHFIAAFGALADRLREAGDLYDSCVIGWDNINEPAEGFVGHEDLNTVPSAQGSTLRKGSHPTPAESLRLGMGQAQTVDHYSFGAFGPSKDGTVTIDPKGHKMWLDPEEEPSGYNERWGWRRDPGWTLGMCIWALHGVWDVGTGYILRPDYFRCPPFDPDRPVVFGADYWRPHWRVYVARIRQAHPECIHFVQPPVFSIPPPLDEDEDLRGRACYSGHYYDGLTLVTRHWNWFNADALGVLRGKYSNILQAVKIGERAIRQSLQEQLGMLIKDTEIIGPYPTLIGEIGIPFDMDHKRSYGYTDGGKHAGDYSRQQRALDASLNAADGPNALNYTIWTYCADSSHMWGDGWNMEDLSLWSRDDLRNRERYSMQITDASSAALLKRKSTPALSRAASSVLLGGGASAMSLNTVGGISVAESEPASFDDAAYVDGDVPAKLQRRGSYQSALAAHPHWANVYDFLTDGARAVRAFSRPYPIATVGVVENVAFDIAKAELVLTICVRPEDRPVVRSGREPGGVREGEGEAPDGEGEERVEMRAKRRKEACVLLREVQQGRQEGEEELSELPTEIYVPVVHYASRELLSSSVVAKAEREQDEPEPEPTHARSCGYPPRRDERAVSYATDDGEERSPTVYAPSATFSGTASSATLALPKYRAHGLPARLVDVEVEVSAGRWEVEGQVLRWWHPVPPACADVDAGGAGEGRGEGRELVHTITIRRAGGAIRTREEERREEGSWWKVCEALCAGECVVM